MSRDLGAEWPYCETGEALERRDRLRELVRDIAGGLALLVAVAATWQGLNIIAVATYAA